MANPFLSSEEYDERAHQLYNEGEYDDALTVLREGLALYPNSVELHVGVGYAQLAREEFAWARRSFEQALVLEPEHEDGLAGLGETLLKMGQDEAAMRCFRRTLELGYADDIDLMLQVGRALFREGSLRENAECFETAKEFFETASQQLPDSAEAVACVAYAQHRLGDDNAAIASLRRSLQLDGDHAEARIYLANILYDQSEFEAALYHFERTNPEDHWDELGIWRLIELKRSLYRLEENDPELKPWDDRLSELASDLDGYEAIEWFNPYMFQSSADEMEQFIRAHQLDYDDVTGFHMVSPDRHFIMVFESSNHERDSSNDTYIVYRRKMSNVPT